MPSLSGGIWATILRENWDPPSWQPARKWGLVLQTPGTQFYPNLNELAGGFFPGACRKEHSPVDPLISGLCETLSREHSEIPCLVSDPWKPRNNKQVSLASMLC